VTKFKPVPPAPPSLEALAEYRRSVPMVPRPEADCRTRVRASADLETQMDAETWLAFLRTLELVAEGERGYYRTELSTDPGRLREALLERGFAAEETLSALEADGPLDGDAAFEAVRDRIPTWERHRSVDWEATWRERIDNLLEWFALIGVAEPAQPGYSVTAAGRQLLNR
jgi:hypothetical protein